MDPDSFREQLDAARAGEGGALGELFRDLYPRLLRFLMAFDRAEAEDLASETWLDVATGLERFSGDERALRAWSFTIARRRLIDLQRARARRPSVSAEPEELEEHAGVGDVEAEALAALGTQAAIERVSRLPRDQAEVLLLRVLGDLAVREVAQILGKRPGTIRVIQHRALKRLADEVAEERVTR